ncbi:NrfD/PsrC family molybdoenzyme membrane anchor subunit [Streptomonospora nanhaiensis]|uniref:Formate-dependent nitrite reductase membrane component NrfD n=1 Tax=Streptomonospora nanhaiensis TaxID=1323731 RepID=A0A853BW44_9ACTN|nr:NrfD/PsrC family molybdoenzyme membrane anchor subunit [Streptomonospora nanhaiensis]MBV2363666.1 polysulfide reductase NrfD [Streptomonospora nanhaiensis]NYI98711.1 formate-dependent nitrite reductase membrane component NrfD [Streptomonospora nanhaiensis]
MSTSDVTREGIRGAHPGREALTGAVSTLDGHRREHPRGRRIRRGEPEFRSYYDKPVLNQIVWEPRDIAGYLFLGGLAGASSVLAAGADLTGRPGLARPLKYTALGAITGSVAALVNDLGRPARFVNMLRVLKWTSPMSVGSWILMAYGPLAGAAAVSQATGILPGLGRAAALGAGAVGPAVAAYTAPLICDTAVPAWHEGFREMPFVFVGSAAAAAGGMGMATAPVSQAGPARRAAVLGSALETAALWRMERRMGMVAEPYRTGRSGLLMRAAKALTVGGAVGALLGARSRRVSAVAGAALLAGSACTRFGVFHAGVASAADPKYTVVPQRRRLEERKAAEANESAQAAASSAAQEAEGSADS